MEKEKSKEAKTKEQRLTQIALRNEAIEVVDKLIELEGSNRLGGSSLSRADVLNDILTKKGAEKLREFYYSKV